MHNIEIKPALYLLYLLHVVYDEDDELAIDQIKSLQLLISNRLDMNQDSKEKLIESTRKIFRSNFKSNFENSSTIIFKIGEVIKTDFASSLIELKFIFDDTAYTIGIFENDLQITTVKFI